MAFSADETNGQLEGSGSLLRDRWGPALDDGFLLLPTVLLRNQWQLGLDAGELVVLENLLVSWREPGRWPVLQALTISKRMGVSLRTVQRQLVNLEKMGLIRKTTGASPQGNGDEITAYDLSGTVTALKLIAQSSKE